MKNPVIPGINPEAALELLDGDTDIYMAILQSFVTNTPPVIEALRNVTVETLPEYAVNIHGLKGICANIGAALTGEKARELEQLAKAGDLSGVIAGNNAFLEMTGKLVNDIKIFLEGK